MAEGRVPTRTREILARRFAAIIEEGYSILNRHPFIPPKYIPADEYLKFRTQAVNLLRTVCGEDTEHYRELVRISERGGEERNSEFLDHYLALLEAARNGFELLLDLPPLISAELFTEFYGPS